MCHNLKIRSKMNILMEDFLVCWSNFFAWPTLQFTLRLSINQKYDPKPFNAYLLFKTMCYKIYNLFKRTFLPYFLLLCYQKYIQFVPKKKRKNSNFQYNRIDQSPETCRIVELSQPSRQNYAHFHKSHGLLPFVRKPFSSSLYIITSVQLHPLREKHQLSQLLVSFNPNM